MPGSIMPLPVMLEEDDQAIYDKLEAPKSIVVRYGYQRMIAELPYNGDAKPGCGSKLVVRSPRGTEIGEMLTTTCDNSGCGKSVSRQQMLKYIENSGGKDYPFTRNGKVLRVATIEDLNEQSRLDLYKPEYIRTCKKYIDQLKLEMHLVEVELLLGGEKVLFYYKADQWVDFRELVKKLAAEFQTRIEMVQVNDREEARLVADYEKCGQHCCCKQFLKVLKPVSMRSAKVQKATLDPQKISGRCGRLMCCLRYEDKTYSELKKKLPHRKSIVETEDGIGIVLDTQILTQLALVKIGMTPPAAYPVENIRVLNKEEAKAWREEEDKRQAELAGGRVPRGKRPPRQRDQTPKTHADAAATPGDDAAAANAPANDGGKKKRRRRRRSRGDTPGAPPQAPEGSNPAPPRPGPGQPLADDPVESKEGSPSADRSADNPGTGGDDGRNDTRADAADQSGGGPKRKRRRRRRKRGDGGPGGEGDDQDTGGGPSNPPPGDRE